MAGLAVSNFKADLPYPHETEVMKMNSVSESQLSGKFLKLVHQPVHQWTIRLFV